MSESPVHAQMADSMSTSLISISETTRIPGRIRRKRPSSSLYTTSQSQSQTPAAHSESLTVLSGTTESKSIKVSHREDMMDTKVAYRSYNPTNYDCNRYTHGMSGSYYSPTSPYTSPSMSEFSPVHTLTSSPELFQTTSSPSHSPSQNDADFAATIISELSSSSTSSSPPDFSLLDALPVDLGMRILSMLNVPALCALSCCSRAWNALSSDSALWSEMYVKRWRVETVNRFGEPWKNLYKERDERERDDFLSLCSDDPETLPFFKQWATEKSKQRRSTKLREVDEFALIESWRCRHHMLGNDLTTHVLNDNPNDQSNSSTCTEHSCNRDTCTFYHPEVSDPGTDLYICEQTGSVHFCGANCEQLSKFHRPQCTISGRWASALDRNLDEIRVDRVHDEDEENENAENDEQFEANGFSLSACFEFGYSHCNTEKETGEVWQRLHTFRSRRRD